MSDQVDVTDASDVILDGAGEVVDGVVQMARGFSGLALSGAFVAGAVAGGAAGYFVCKRMLETKYSEIAAEEIAEMQQHYNDKVVALQGAATKPGLEALVRDQGYAQDEEKASQPPMAVSPPSAVTEAAQEAQEEQPQQARVKVDGVPVEQPQPTEARNIFQEHGDDQRPPDAWDYAKERAQRSPLRPYVIHIDERQEHDAYEGVTFTYYEEDDVLCNERDDAIDEADRERIVGETNLERFGHGSGDSDIVYIRNDQLSMDIEVVRSEGSFLKEVHGIEPEIKHADRRRERRSFDDD